jgi:hypothetical protein
MPGLTMTAVELADELGRKVGWIHDNWRAEVEARRLPAPLNGGAPPLVWDRAQVYALRDRPLRPEHRALAVAYRAAVAAAEASHADSGAADRMVESRAHLDRLLGRETPA